MKKISISNFLNNNKIKIWPKKSKYRELLREYLISKIEVNKKYSEEEINELLSLYHEFNDPAFLRRELCDYKLLKRDKFGKQYWKI